MADGESPRAPRRLPEPGWFDLKVKRASAGLGLFAAEPIPKGARIIEYVGKMLTEEEYQASRSAYLFDVGPPGALDGAPRWNKARYINHSCRPNCEPIIRKRRVMIHSIRKIAAGEELSYDYGSEYFDEAIAGRCRCVKCRPELHKKPAGAKRKTGAKRPRTAALRRERNSVRP